MAKTYTIISTRNGRVNPTTGTITGTLADLIDAFGYTLECGVAYQNEKGNHKINKAPKTIKSLVDNLNKAKTNSAANGSPETVYSLKKE